MINRAQEAFYDAPSESTNAAFIRERVGDIEFVHVYGDVDMANIEEFERSINGPHSMQTRIFADLTNCRYIDSTGLAVLVRAKKNFGEKFSVGVEPGSNVERILKLTSLYSILI